MRARERRQEIADLAAAHGLASVEEMSARFGVTASTIRRDLAKLTEDGALARTYGGAIAVNAPLEQSLSQRSAVAQAAKAAIARWAGSQVAPGDHVLLDAGTSTAALARVLRRTTPLTVATTGISVIEALRGAEDIEVIALGGQIREMSQGFVGPLTERALELMTFDMVFLGADAVTADSGICEASLVQTRLKELMAAKGGRVHLLVHAEKLGQRPFHCWAPLTPATTVVTDDSATDEALAPFVRRGIPVVVVDGHGVGRPAA